MALSILLILIIMAWTAIIYTDIYQSRNGRDMPIQEQISHDTIRLNIIRAEKEHVRKRDELHPEGERIRSDRNESFVRKKTEKGIKSFNRSIKFPKGTVVEMNSADTTTLKKVPGIGSAFARRIVKYRELLGGFYSADQLSEVYGIDEERYRSLRGWFTADSSLISPIYVNNHTAKELVRHPYIDYKQARAIEKMVKRRGALKSIEELSLLDEFKEEDINRIRHYLSFE